MSFIKSDSEWYMAKIYLTPFLFLAANDFWSY